MQMAAASVSWDDEDRYLDNLSLVSFLVAEGKLDGRLATDKCAQYLAKRTARLDVDRLSLKLGALQQKSVAIREKRQALASTNYRTFTKTSECVTAMQAQLADMSSARTPKLSNSLPLLAGGLNTFVECGGTFLSRSKEKGKVLSNLQTLLELLEIPQLMDTCIRSQAFAEALQLDAFARAQYARHPCTILEQIVGEVTQLEKVLQQNLEQCLCVQQSLLASVKTVGLLKQLAVYDKHELAVTFLTCKNNGIQSALSAIVEISAFSYLSKVIEVFRSFVLDCVTQYRVLFSPETPASPNSNANADTDQDDVGLLLHSWVTFQVTFLSETMLTQLQRISELPLLSTLADQCMYAAGVSLSHVGLDLRGLLLPIFTQRILAVFTGSVNAAVTAFAQDLPKYSIPPMVTTGTAPDTSGTAPPAEIARYLPMAMFANKLLTILNLLRCVAPPTLKRQLAAPLEAVLSAGVAAVVRRCDAAAADSIADADALADFVQVFATAFVPHICRCFDLVFQSPYPLLSPLQLAAPLTAAAPPRTVAAKEAN
eukprot:TRINITY_DN17119_c0_g1_i1.p1 TRINITY_DN17119_c0_g1~~TRINITY_DN17119_c0_g1_i1.p1  ORF type:complete len:541 (-),score=172.49 TRINITY_DN17119_c0_g1_i1:54-1676(-)